MEAHDEATAIVLHGVADTKRPVVRVCAGPAWITGDVPVVKPQPDFSDRDTAVEGVVKRFACQTPMPSRRVLRRLHRFVYKYLRKNFKPIDPGEDASFETWLAETNYPEWRKAELREANTRLCETGLRKKDRKIKSFIKQETYPEFKYARAINSRSDVFKVFSGPFFKLIEKKVFAHGAFIKKIPVADRPRYIMERLAREGCKILETDYTSFEALFRPEIMEAVEMQLYEYMTSARADGREWYNTIHEVLVGENVCHFKNFKVRTRGRRMSGEMCTSLGNSFSNLMFMLFMAEEKGAWTKGVVEGDDGLFAWHGPLPTSADFERLGLRIKLEVRDDVSSASFCGLIFDPQDLVNIRDPRDVLAEFAWVDQRYARARGRKLLALLRCKALSIAHQYPGCPILAALARYGLRVTAGLRIERLVQNSGMFDLWTREKLLQWIHKDIPDIPVPMRTRELMYRKFGVLPSTQVRLEEMFDLKQDLSPYRIPDLDVPESWIHYGSLYTFPQRLSCWVEYAGPDKNGRRFDVV